VRANRRRIGGREETHSEKLGENQESSEKKPREEDHPQEQKISLWSWSNREVNGGKEPRMKGEWDKGDCSKVKAGGVGGFRKISMGIRS